MYQKNCAITSSDSPLPISSSTYRHRNCIISTNWQMKNVPTNSSPNCLVMNISNFLMRNIPYFAILAAKLQKRSEKSLYTLVFLSFIPIYYYRPLALCRRSRLLSHRIFSPSASSSSAKSVISRFRWWVRSLWAMRISQ